MKLIIEFHVDDDLYKVQIKFGLKNQKIKESRIKRTSYFNDY